MFGFIVYKIYFEIIFVKDNNWLIYKNFSIVIFFEVMWMFVVDVKIGS